MVITQAQFNKNWPRSEEINALPFILGQSGKSSFIIWAIVHGTSTRGFICCSHNAFCVQSYASDEREPHLSTC